MLDQTHHVLPEEVHPHVRAVKVELRGIRLLDRVGPVQDSVPHHADDSADVPPLSIEHTARGQLPGCWPRRVERCRSVLWALASHAVLHQLLTWGADPFIRPQPVCGRHGRRHRGARAEPVARCVPWGLRPGLALWALLHLPACSRALRLSFRRAALRHLQRAELRNLLRAALRTLLRSANLCLLSFWPRLTFMPRRLCSRKRRPQLWKLSGIQLARSVWSRLVLCLHRCWLRHRTLQWQHSLFQLPLHRHRLLPHFSFEEASLCICLEFRCLCRIALQLLTPCICRGAVFLLLHVWSLPLRLRWRGYTKHRLFCIHWRRCQCIHGRTK
mmetsp:Transcript_66821/g.215391  ORF Transcript_66821/g.215391 Transcript_66821/m.215391 type:complete len:329 (-) Transcript_66821:1712-2698(-)